MGRRAVEIEIIFFDILAVIALGIGQSEEALLQDRVLSVPQGNSKAQPVVVVAETGEAVLAPVIGTGAGLIVGEVVPRITVLAVVLADRAPLSFAEIRPPLLPGHPLLARLVETPLLRGFRFQASLVRQRPPPAQSEPHGREKIPVRPFERDVMAGVTVERWFDSQEPRRSAAIRKIMNYSTIRRSSTKRISPSSSISAVSTTRTRSDSTPRAVSDAWPSSPSATTAARAPARDAGSAHRGQRA